MTTNIVQHPSAKEMIADTHKRFSELRSQQEAAQNRMWAATLAMHFTEDELAILDSLLSPHDWQLLKLIGRGRKKKSPAAPVKY